MSLFTSLFLIYYLSSRIPLFEHSKNDDEVVENIKEKKYKYGFDVDSFHIAEGMIQPNQFLGTILSGSGISYSIIDEISKKARDVFNVRDLRAGKKFALVSKDSCSTIDYFVYEPNPYRYVLYKTTLPVSVEIREREVENCVESAIGIINSSLWLSMAEEGHKFELISEMESALAWTIDFHHIQKGDRYKLIFERKYIEGESVGVGRLLGAYFENYSKPYYSIYFENDRHFGFYDEEGRSMEKAFLKAPVKYSRISSRYNRRRFHPVLKRYKGHFGTDYAAPRGTPIFAVADGLVTQAGYTKGNGNYVRIKHDEIYQSQYLHMSKFAKGLKAGGHVKQNEVIGYVGSTGLATGPHVCFRFWKNGKQVDHLRENLPPPEPMPEKDLPEFFRLRDKIVAELDQMTF
jgi:murein DD-endopeptidase MepM/ murein hydrolase activator NlpD